MSDIKPKRVARESVPSHAVIPPTEAAAAVAEAAPTGAPAFANTTASTAPTRAAAPAPEDLFAYGQQSWAALAEAQAAAARGLEALVREMTTFTRSEMGAAADSATAILGVKTFAQAVEVYLGYARRSFDALIGSAAKLSEIGVKAAAEASRPILSRLG